MLAAGDGQIAPYQRPATNTRCCPPYSGYYWEAGGGEWVPGIPDNESWFRPAPRHTIGGAVFYAPYLMEATARYRRLSLAGYRDGVAMMSPADIGQTVWLRRPGHGWEGPFLVVDSARRSDIWPVIAYRGEVVEVGFETARRWGMVQGSAGSWRTLRWRLDGVELYKGFSPPVGGAGEPVHYPNWWLARATFAARWEPAPHWRNVDGYEWLIGGEWVSFLQDERMVEYE